MKNMNTINRQCAGIDVSKEELYGYFAVIDNEQGIRHLSVKTFRNSSIGFNQLERWANKLSIPDKEIYFVMEATGVYYESLAYFLHRRGRKVSVVLPNKFKNYARSLNYKSKNDWIDAKVIATMGVERKLDLWQPPAREFRTLKQLTREHEQLLDEKTVVMNQLHAVQSSEAPSATSIKRMKQRIKLVEKQVKIIKEEIKQVVKECPCLQEKIEKVCTIPGIQLHTAVTIIAETDGFALIKNKSQLVSYAGYDVVERQSGSSVNGKTRISKKGNKHIRRALHFPALSAAMHNPNMTSLYERIYTKQGVKMKGLVAVQRKLLVLIYTLWKNDTEYNKQYKQAA